MTIVDKECITQSRVCWRSHACRGAVMRVLAHHLLHGCAFWGFLLVRVRLHQAWLGHERHHVSCHKSAIVAQLVTPHLRADFLAVDQQPGAVCDAVDNHQPVL